MNYSSLLPYQILIVYYTHSVVYLLEELWYLRSARFAFIFDILFGLNIHIYSHIITNW